LLLLQMVV
jgi:hypothetical protein